MLRRPPPRLLRELGDELYDLQDDAGIVPGEDPDVDAIVLAYTVAFDSVSDFEAKAQYIDDPSGLEETVAQYLVTGETMGGIGVEVSEVTIEGNTARLVYDLLSSS